MKKVKKWIIPLLCATLLLLGSSMTVFASDIVMPEDYNGGNYLAVTSSGKYYFVESDCDFYVDSIGRLRIDLLGKTDNSYLHIWRSSTEGTTWDIFSYVFSEYVFSDKYFTIISSNVNVYQVDSLENSDLVKDEEHIFFQGPLPLIAQAIKTAKLPEVVQTQTKTITTIAVCLLALVIGSLVLVPRLRNWVRL